MASPIARAPELWYDAAMTSYRGPQVNRRTVLGLGVAGAALARAPASAAAPFDLEEATVLELRRRLEAGKETARSLVDKYLARIEALDRRGPELRSVIEVNP